MSKVSGTYINESRLWNPICKLPVEVAITWLKVSPQWCDIHQDTYGNELTAANYQSILLNKGYWILDFSVGGDRAIALHDGKFYLYTK
jgi:hypothetical protein